MFLNVVQVDVKVTGRKSFFEYLERFEEFQPLRATEREVMGLAVTPKMEAAHSSK
jgi:hypothetical protein